MSLREWLIAIGTLVILGIVIDGIRRMRRARKESMAISSGMGADKLDESPLDEDYNPELPNGGARAVSREVLEKRGYVRSEKTGPGKISSRPVRPVRRREPDVPADDPVETGLSSVDTGDEGLTAEGWSARDEEASADAEVGSAPGAAGRKKVPDTRGKAEPAPPVVTSEVEEDTARRPAAPKRRPDQPLAGANRPEALEVIVINVLARSGEQFEGKALQKLFEACGLEYGDLSIYHRHEQPDTTSPVQFSVANAVEPGTFRPEEMASLRTPGISFFMSLPGPSNAMQAFDFMLETAQCVVRNLGGELKDERRSVMTPQTVEHCRQRIREFERKHRSRRK